MSEGNHWMPRCCLVTGKILPFSLCHLEAEPTHPTDECIPLNWRRCREPPEETPQTHCWYRQRDIWIADWICEDIYSLKSGKQDTGVLFLTYCKPMYCSPPGSSVHVILQARILEWVAMYSYRRASPPRDWTQVSHVAGRFFTIWAIREVRQNKES